jgi:ArsR family transcriptional regulator
MRICIPVETPAGPDARVYGHFGSAPHFAICDLDSGGIETLSNGGQQHAHGQCQPTAALAGRQVDAVVCAGLGLRALQRLRASGIGVYQAAGATVNEVLAAFKAGKQVELTERDACGEHRCH